MLNNYINVDLHIHSKISEYKEGKIKKNDETELNIVADSDIAHIDSLLKLLNDKKINLFSFTDHNRFDAKLFLETKKKIESKNWENIKNLVAGCEFDVQIEENKPSCHIITIFDVKSDEDANKVENEINKNKLNSKDSFYKLYEFENLMKNIGLNSIFIACQRKSLNNESGGKNSISNSVDDIYEFLKVAFISGLEYQKSSVEGMLIDNLKDFPKEIGLVCGSDCHQWSVYPKHDETENNPTKKFYFIIKALPTFLGLLFAFSSPKTRFYTGEKGATSYLKSIKKGDSEVFFSNGLNAIIGENGSGKSTLLSYISSQKMAKYQELIIKENKFTIEKNSSFKRKLVEQNEIINKNNKKNIFDNDCYSDVNTDIFTNNVRDFSKKILNWINYKIAKTKKFIELNENLELDVKKYYSRTYYVTASFPGDTEMKNEYRGQVINLDNIIKKIETELDDLNYTDFDRNKLASAYNLIVSVRNSCLAKYKDKYFQNEVYRIINVKLKDYEKKIKDASATDDTMTSNYKNVVNNFLAKIKNYYKQFVLVTNLIPTFDNYNIGGISEKKKNGYKFIKTTKYYNMESIEDAIFKKVFNKDFQSIEKLGEIDSIDLLANAITGASAENYEAKYIELVDKFISESCEFDYDVIDISQNNKMGSTLGEKSLVYYKYLSYETNDFDILFIDQPEDNISNIRIKKDLVNYLNNLRKTKQVFFVTHNPILVVNLDVDNVIVLDKHNNSIDISSGCLETPELLGKISTLLDGGQEEIEKRLKLYYGK